MGLSSEDVQTIRNFHGRVRQACADFHNSNVLISYPDPELGRIFGDLEFTLTDILEVAVLTRTHTLLTGGTGYGKTDIVRMVATAAFGTSGWSLLRLNPNLNEQTFANLRLDKLREGAEGGMRECVEPAELLSSPLLVLDEVNRTPAALTNILLGHLDGRIELKFGIKQDVGYDYVGADGLPRRFNLVMATMNDGHEYHGTFQMDRALQRRFTFTIPLDACRPTDADRVSVMAGRSGRADIPVFDSMIDELAPLSERVARLPIDDLAFVYMVYLMCMDRCPNQPTGFKNLRPGADVCARSDCRIFKIGEGFCGFTGRLSEALAIYLKKAAMGLAAVRAARVIETVEKTCLSRKKNASRDRTKLLQEYANVETEKKALLNAVVQRYLERLAVVVDDVQALLPFIAYGGKVWIAEDYISKHFAGDKWGAYRRYAAESYNWLEKFFREQEEQFTNLSAGKGTVEVLRERLEYAQRYTDPFIKHAVEPFLERHTRRRSQEEVEEELVDRRLAWEVARSMVNVSC